MQLLHSSIDPNWHCARAALAYLCLNEANTYTQSVTEMAYQSTISTPAGSSLANRLSAFVAELRTKAARRKIYRETLRELQSLNARELNDLGLNKTMLKRVAYQATYGS